MGEGCGISSTGRAYDTSGFEGWNGGLQAKRYFDAFVRQTEERNFDRTRQEDTNREPVRRYQSPVAMPELGKEYFICLGIRPVLIGPRFIIRTKQVSYGNGEASS